MLVVGATSAIAALLLIRNYMPDWLTYTLVITLCLSLIFMT